MSPRDDLIKDYIMKNVNIILDAIHESFERQNERELLLVEKMRESLSNINDGLSPNIDINGRYHAPISGYTSEDGAIYRKGEYIPFEASGDMKGITVCKVRAVGSAFLSAIRENEVLVKSLGTSWFDSKGVETANLYLEIANGFTNDIVKVVESVNASYEVKIVPCSLDGKLAVEGEILKFWTGINNYSYNATTIHGFNVRLNDGAIYSGTLPKSLYDAKVGDIVKFTASFTKGKKAFKRPSKASVI